ncbi:hypothetical protein FDO65_10220 [Nakamurella flava]|uniref:Uncharacterized protein n=1 Tax=Nakamurella flava TaxID=2576308 RepID=A0A4U6QML7_9ACTN|nr:hypothetical protein [Nakamurella flava]TKV61890.1 hypothetical protein FDO65_10220 [Nakamurella flava]
MPSSVITNGTRAAAAAGLTSLITHWGVVDTAGAAIGSRVANTAVIDGTYTVRPSADLNIPVPAGATVGGVRAYDAATGGTDRGGWNYAAGETPGRETFNGAGVYQVTAASSGFQVP